MDNDTNIIRMFESEIVELAKEAGIEAYQEDLEWFISKILDKASLRLQVLED